jgi:glucokinase
MIIAVDTGATKTLVTSFVHNKKSSKNHRFLTPRNIRVYIDTLSQILTSQYDLKEVSAISIGSTGLIEKDTILSCANLGWKNFTLVDSLRKKLDTRVPIFLENDANLAGLAEINALPLSPKIGLYVTISTGIGTGIVINNIIDPLLRRSEGGQNVLEFDGILQTWESFSSGRAIYETYGKYAHDIQDEHIWELIADKISRGFLSIIPLLQPNAIVIGGSIGTYFSQYEKNLKAILQENIKQSITLPFITQAKHPEEAVIYGCNIYANQPAA